MRLLILIKKFFVKVQNVFTLLLGGVPVYLDISIVSDAFKFFFRNMLLWWIELILFTLVCVTIWHILKRIGISTKNVESACRIFSHVLTFVIGFLLALTIYALSYTYGFEDYKNAVFDGKTEIVELYYSKFSHEKDFFIKYENENVVLPCVLLWGIENQHRGYKEIFAIARKNNFNIEYKFSYSYYTKLKKTRYRTVAYERIFYAIGEFLGTKYGNQFTSSQYLLALSEADFSQEFLEFLYVNGFNFEEGLQLREEIRQYIHSNDFHIYNRKKDRQLQATLSDFLAKEEARTEKICTFLKEKGLRSSACWSPR